MKIAVMLRTLEERQGIGIYARNLCASLLKIDKYNKYYFFYSKEDQAGAFGKHENLREIVLRVNNKILWDQVAVSHFARKYGIDIIFNTKFSVPLITSCQTVMVLHGSEWYVFPEFYAKLDILYTRLFLPLYFRKATALSCVSKFTADDITKYVRIDASKLFVVRSAIDPIFKPIKDKRILNNCRNKFNLPERYILCVAKSYPGKNIINIMKAFKTIKKEASLQIKLVAVGDLCQNREKYCDKAKSFGLNDDVVYTGWVQQNDLPAIYSLADVFLFPSFYEGFGIPIVEAMACGCPVVTSNTGACPEIAGSAAIFVDPKDVGSIATGVIRVLKDDTLRSRMIKQGYIEAKRFSWEKTAKATLDIFHFVDGHGN